MKKQLMAGMMAASMALSLKVVVLVIQEVNAGQVR